MEKMSEDAKVVTVTFRCVTETADSAVYAPCEEFAMVVPRGWESDDYFGPLVRSTMATWRLRHAIPMHGTTILFVEGPVGGE